MKQAANLWEDFMNKDARKCENRISEKWMDGFFGATEIDLEAVFCRMMCSE